MEQRTAVSDRREAQRNAHKTDTSINIQSFEFNNPRRKRQQQADWARLKSSDAIEKDAQTPKTKTDLRTQPQAPHSPNIVSITSAPSYNRPQHTPPTQISERDLHLFTHAERKHSLSIPLKSLIGVIHRHNPENVDFSSTDLFNVVLGQLVENLEYAYGNIPHNKRSSLIETHLSELNYSYAFSKVLSSLFISLLHGYEYHSHITTIKEYIEAQLHSRHPILLNGSRKHQLLLLEGRNNAKITHTSAPNPALPVAA
jgi:hypothetical protein